MVLEACLGSEGQVAGQAVQAGGRQRRLRGQSPSLANGGLKVNYPDLSCQILLTSMGLHLRGPASNLQASLSPSDPVTQSHSKIGSAGPRSLIS